jgi:hypothetical protein
LKSAALKLSQAQVTLFKYAIMKTAVMKYGLCHLAASERAGIKFPAFNGHSIESLAGYF